MNKDYMVEKKNDGELSEEELESVFGGPSKDYLYTIYGKTGTSESDMLDVAKLLRRK